MSITSINTNAGALIALQNLNATAAALTQTQNIVSTGLKVSTAKDDGSTWAIAQNQRSDISSLGVVKDSLNRGSSTVDVAVSAGQTITDLLTQIRTKVLAATDSSLDSTSRSALNEDFKALRDQITTVVSNAQFNGKNLISGTSTNLASLISPDGVNRLTVAAEDLSVGGSNISFSATASFATATAASTLLPSVSSSLTAVEAAVARLGTSSQRLTLQTDLVSKLTDTSTTGLGNLVDADLGQESAKLQALQSKQQLGVQALGIANGSPQSLLTLFK